MATHISDTDQFIIKVAMFPQPPFIVVLTNDAVLFTIG